MVKVANDKLNFRPIKGLLDLNEDEMDDLAIELKKLIIKCWQSNEDDRPLPSEIRTELESIYERINIREDYKKWNNIQDAKKSKVSN